MGDWLFNLESVVSLSAISNDLSCLISPYLAKQMWSHGDRKKLLDGLAEMFLRFPDDENIINFAHALGPVMHDILHRCFERCENCNEDIIDNFGILLGELMQVNQTKFIRLVKFDYFLERYFSTRNENLEACPSKKQRLLPRISLNVALCSIAQIVRNSSGIALHNWPWQRLFSFVLEARNRLNMSGILAITEILSLVLQLPRNTMGMIRSEMIHQLDSSDSSKFRNCARQWDCQVAISEGRTKVHSGKTSYTKRGITSNDFSKNIIVAAGVMIDNPTQETVKSEDISGGIVITDSLQGCLRSLALGTANRHPIMISGPAGCGKTTLIKHFAKTIAKKRLIEVQLGDGVDSKVLSGVYKCTATCGEFEWQPGVLAQAVSKGDWILLEDIDKAPLDVISLLLPILENGTMKYTGHSTVENTASDSCMFRIFMTCRTSGDNNLSNMYISKLKRHSRCIEMDGLSDEDLKAIIESRYPKIRSVSDKVLEIYKSINEIVLDVSCFDSKVCKRASSVRDLLRFCRRLPSHMIKERCDLGQAVALEGVDCLVASVISNQEKKQKVHALFSLLNLSSSNADYFCQSYIPEITFHGSDANIGRATLPINDVADTRRAGNSTKLFALNRSSSILLERLACAVSMKDPVLLVGETGVGKTTGIQYLADKLGCTLHIVNISQQSSSSDLLGAFKPVQRKHLMAPVRNQFEKLFVQTFSKQQNEKFLSHVQACYLNKRFNDLLQLMTHGTKQALKKKELSARQRVLWQEMSDSIADIKSQIKVQESVAFAFVEGILSKALRNGEWLLLDEINLASPETLDCLSTVLESDEGSVSLLEIGDTKPINRHPDFRVFAAMNPATDVGKRNLPNNIRSRFLEIYVPEPSDDADLQTIIGQYLKGRIIRDNSVVDGILKFYRQICKYLFQDGSRGIKKPHYSLRSLCRALRYVTDNPKMRLIQALFEGLCLAFLTEIDHSRHETITDLILKNLKLSSKDKSFLKIPLPRPIHKHVTVEGYHIKYGCEEPYCDEKYIMTPHIKKNLKVLARAVSYGKYPILIQGETSTGKTSMIKYLASLTGNKVFRINNHEHTDLQEYIGTYSSDSNGKFYFQEGPLVAAMRNGHWIILDELNLAPTDILESLNRVLDDNRELFIPETQETVVAHPRFAIFATQNPPGVYGGRKVLSRALRNRFIELHFGQIPSDEIKTILHLRCGLPMSRCKKLINVMEDLQEQRSSRGIFAGRHSYITLRDLFRWAERYRCGHSVSDSFDWDQQLANDGYMLLAGKVRSASEELLIQEAIQTHLKRKVNPEEIFGQEAVNNILKQPLPDEFKHIVFTSPLRKLVVMLHRALTFNEPVLLVGDTGCGKTTACQLVSALRNKNDSLSIINCHSHTDASDFLGGLRPVRHSNNDETDNNKLFEWVDGPLVHAMLNGSGILVDEISLAEDSVLERLNSVLEPSRMLVIPDRVGSENAELDLTIQAHCGFQFMATMNPGGDFGKKELSPALRNRLTEIWCTAVNENMQEVTDIVKHNLIVPDHLLEPFSEIIVAFMKWFMSTTFGSKIPRSIRDIMKWIQFCNTCYRNGMNPVLGIIHGALLVFVDGIGSGISDTIAALSKEARLACVAYILKSLKESNLTDDILSSAEKQFLDLAHGHNDHNISLLDGYFRMGPFQIELGPLKNDGNSSYFFQAPSTSVNVFRLLRALQSPNPILLEGSPGIGKTSLVVALARATGHEIVRINLSEQTDISDLLGADLPVEDGVGGQFTWRDGPLLTALKNGSWVVFDELNLASQSVLEGLNSVFDHRNEIFVPELGITFNVKCDQTRIFACQNPYYQGGGRKGLPKSFLNRFNQVYIEPLSEADMVVILSSQFSSLPVDIIKNMVKFNLEIKRRVVEQHLWGHAGSPWEFNLRDLTRWCDLTIAYSTSAICPEAYVYLIYGERFQKCQEREHMFDLYESVFGVRPYTPTCTFNLSESYLVVGNAKMQRQTIFSVSCSDVLLLPSMLHSMESLMNVLQQGWMAILTGGSGCGKTTLVKTLATLLGKKLRVFSVNSCMDATELLGGFEQMDFLRHLSSVPTGLISELMGFCNDKSNLLSPSDSELTIEILGFIQSANELKSEISEGTDVSSALKGARRLQNFLSSFSTKCCHGRLPSALLVSVQKYQALLVKVISKIEHSHGKFEWIDSELVEALKSGDWLLIEGANLCSPSVLDRLNALLEPGGTLTITERGVIDGSFVEIAPHPAFRVILSLDTSEGNLSRAMRNRGVEIHMLSQENCAGVSRTMSQVVMGWDEVKRIIECSLSYCPHGVGIQISHFLLHLFQSENVKETNSRSLMLKCMQCAQELSESIAAGMDAKSSMLAICSKYSCEETLENLIADFDYVSDKSQAKRMPIIKLNSIVHDTNTAMVFYQGQYFNEVQSYYHQEGYDDLLFEAACYFVRLASHNDWEARIKYLSNFVLKTSSDSEKFHHGLQNVITSSHYNKLIEFDDILKHLPWDFQMQIQLLSTLDKSLLSTLNKSMLDSMLIHTNACILLFVTRLQHFELDKKLQDRVSAQSHQKAVGRRKSKRRKNVEKIETDVPGPLVLSCLYHNGVIKSQNLQDPCFVFLRPLYETIFSFIYECIDAETAISDKDMVMAIEKISEISYIWREILIVNVSDSTLVLMSVRQIEKAFLFISSLYAECGSKTLTDLLLKIESLFLSINEAFAANWATLRQQNKLRILHGRITLAAAPFQSESEFLFSKRLNAVLQNISCAYRTSCNLQLHEQPERVVHELCNIWSDMISAQTFQEPNNASDMCEIVKLENKFDTFLEKFNGVSNDTNTRLPYKVQWCLSSAEMARYFYLRNLMKLLMLSKKDEMTLLVSTSCKEIIAAFSSSHIINANVLSRFMLLKQVCERKMTYHEDFELNHLLSIILTLLNEASLSEVVCQSSAHTVGASAMIKPAVSQAFYNIMYSKHMRSTKALENDVPLTNLSSDTLKIWNGVLLPLSEYETRISLLRSLNVRMWEDCFHTLHGSHQQSHENLIQCSCVFLHYFQVTLNLITNIQELPGALYDPMIHDQLSSILEKIHGVSILGLKPELIDSLIIVCKKMLQSRPTQNSMNLSWLAELKTALKNAVNCVLTMVTKLTLCRHAELDVKEKKLQIMSFLYLGMSWVWTSAINYQLISPQNNFDPVEFCNFKCNTLEHQLRKHKNGIRAHSMYVSTTTGHSLVVKDNQDLSCEKHIHPLIPLQYKRINAIETKVTAMKNTNAYRPMEQPFKELVQLCRQTYESFFSSHVNVKMLENIGRVIHQLELNNCNFQDRQLEIDINKLRGIRSSISTFLESISKFTAFPDFCIPVQDSVNHFSMGCSIIENALQPCLTLAIEVKNGITMENLFNYLISIENHPQPIPKIMAISEDLVKQQWHKSAEQDSQAMRIHVVEDLLIALLLKLRNIVLFEGTSSHYMRDLKYLTDYVVSELDKQQKEETLKSEEKAGLYKVKHHLQDLDEQKIENDQFCGIFGYNPEEGRDDLIIDEALHKDIDSPLPTTDSILKYTENLGKIAMQVHKDVSALAGSTSNNDGSNSVHDLTMDLTLPSMYASNKMQSLFVSQYNSLLDMKVDDNLINAHMAAIHQCIKTFEGDFGSTYVSCNIYRDPLISEAKCCLPILDKLVGHITTSLLNQWPDHPVLLKILEICGRVKDFTAASPLIRFVSGMEILVESVQEWEKNACSNVSLSEFMNDIVRLIFKWRKMELSNWSRLIDDEYKKLSSIKPSLYFSLYQLISSQFDESTIRDFITQLENLMESSTLPQFCPRLDTLAVFMGHMSVHGMSGNQVFTSLKNVHSYYCQFKASVTERLQSLRKPIEKDLKEFVSITKWNDSNFFAMKNSVEKAHKHLFKLIKKFSLAMREKVQCNILVQGSNSIRYSLPFSDTTSQIAENKVELDSRSLCEADWTFPESLVPLADFPILGRLSTFSHKLQKICKYDNDIKIATSITSIEDSITEIINAAQQLHDAKPATVANVNDEKAKAKRISEAKNIKLRKQKSLSDLFKYLSEIGLSYKKGLISNKELTSQDLLLTEVPSSAKNVTVSVSSGSIKVDTICGENIGRDYFYQIILKWSCINIAASVPHKDLTKPTLDRCTGFVGNLMKHSVSQRQLLSATVTSTNAMEKLLSSLKDISQGNFYRDQATAKCFIFDSAKIVNLACSLLEEFNIWMECCPVGTSVEDHFDVNIDQNNRMFHGCVAWSTILTCSQGVLEEAYRIKTFLGNLQLSHSEVYVYTKSDVVEVRKLLNSLLSNFDHFVVTSMREFGRNIPTMITRCKDHSTCMTNISHKYEQVCKEDVQSLSCESSLEREILLKTESLISKVLITVQEFKKAETGYDGDDIFKWMNEEVCNQIKRLSPDILTDELWRFSELIIENLSNVKTEFIQSISKAIVAVVKEYHVLLHQLKVFLHQMNRTTMKLCYVLGGIFLQLSKNGFCTPEDVKEEVDDGDGTELEDAEGGGVGEGEGSNDVSDQIEDQEMLEDKPGEEQDESCDNNIEASENAIEMDNDFDGQFDENDTEQQNNEKSDDDEEQDLENRMGELGEGQNQEKLDEQFWGSDEEVEDEEKEKDVPNENGPGAEERQEELAAKDNIPEDQLQDDVQSQNDENDKPNDESEFNPSEVDPYADNDNKEDCEDENLNLPDNFNLDEETLEDEVNDNEADDDPAEQVSNAGDDVDEEDLKEDGPFHEDMEEGDCMENEEEENVDMDAQDPLPADEALSKDESNTMNDIKSEDQNQKCDDKDSANLEQHDNKVPPADSSNETENEGLAPAKDFDETSNQYSQMNKDEKTETDNNVPNKKREPKSHDEQDLANMRDSAIEERLNMVDPVNIGNNENEFPDDKQPIEAEAYGHVHSPTEHYDKKVFDSVDQEVDMIETDTTVDVPIQDKQLNEAMDVDDEYQNIKDDNMDGICDPESNQLQSEIHTNFLTTTNFAKYMNRSDEEIEKIRKSLEEKLQSWRNNEDSTVMRDAESAWEGYCYLTRPLAIELCEQLRLVLEPTQASQLKGDYRTGKRLNIRKMIPYIASGYRKDKIWLRRTKPNKRTYQVMLAVDDSSSMIDNHTKQLAFESAAVISGALSSLEVGQFSICSFGDDVELLQSFGETFTTKSGASFLKRCTFSQTKTKIAKFLDYSTDLFRSASKMNHHNSGTNVSQLLLIISDGRGLYLEGRKRVLESVNAIQQAGVFVVFVILDQPKNGEGSISDIKVPVFVKPGEMPEIRSYMKDFPFPFYVILRNINVLPQTLGEALRQWFVLVAGSY